MKEYTFTAGKTITERTIEAIEYSETMEESIIFIFNGVSLAVNRHSDVEETVQEYHRLVNTTPTDKEPRIATTRTTVTEILTAATEAISVWSRIWRWIKKRSSRK